MKINLAKILMDFYPDDMIKQFKKVSLLFYFGLSLELAYTVLNLNHLLHAKAASYEMVFAFFFLFPVVTLVLSLGLLLSSIHIIRHNNPIILYYIGLKKVAIYMLNLGMLLTSIVLLFIYFVFFAHFTGLF